MRVRDPAAVVAGEWVAKADNDLKNAAWTVRLGASCPTDTVAFHAQQCVEKYLKALLVWQSISTPRTHNIRSLVTLLPAGLRLEISVEMQDRLTEYATVTRYPGEYEPIPLAEARVAVQAARQVRSQVRKLLPRNITRRPLRQNRK